MRFGVVIIFLKKHYEKIILCVVLLALVAALVWAGSAIHDSQTVPNPGGAPGKPKALVPIDLTTNMQALAAATNPPRVVLSGEHNLFNPVTWRRPPGAVDLRKYPKTGPDALKVVNITPLYTVIAYDHASSGEVYVLSVQLHSGKKTPVYSKKDEKKKGVPYILRGTEGGTPDDPETLKLELSDSQQVVNVTKAAPYKEVDGYLTDIRYDPDNRSFVKLKVGDPFTLDGEPYKIFEISSNMIRVQSIRNTKVTAVPLNPAP